MKQEERNVIQKKIIPYKNKKKNERIHNLISFSWRRIRFPMSLVGKSMLENLVTIVESSLLAFLSYKNEIKFRFFN